MQTASIHLPEIVVTDWLMKLGDSAFGAWLRLRIWKQQNELKIPIRHLIKKLGVANNTFYSKILTPLWDHGLVEVHAAENNKRCMYLSVYDTPLNLSEKSFLPLERFRSYQSSPISCSKNCNVADIETIPKENVSKKETVSYFETKRCPVVAKDETFSVQEHSISYLYNQDLLLKDKEKEKEIKEKNDPIDRSSFPSSISSLPLHLQTEIQNNPKLHDQIPVITELYQQFQVYPLFSLPVFIEKMSLCLEKVKNRSAYKAYFQKTLVNLWWRRQPNFTLPNLPKSKTKQTHDLPIWIIQQDERSRSNRNEEQQEIPFGKKVEIERMMKELDELCRTW